MGKLSNFLKRYWLELVVFGVILAILMIDMAPNWTYMDKAADSIGYAYSAQYFYPAYHTSAPLFLILGHFFMLIPIATQAWRFELLSVLATMGTCLFVYLIVKNKLNRWYALLGTLIVGMSAIVISQSIIIETYPLVTMLATGAFYFAMKKKWYWTAVFLGAGLAVHLLAFFVFFIFLLWFKEYRKNWKALLITISFGLFYLYIPLSSRNAPSMWLPRTDNFVLTQIKDIWTTIAGLVGQIAIYDVPKRIIDTIGIVGVSVGVVALIPIVAYFWRKKFYKDVLFWLILIPIGLFISELDMDTFDYTMLAIPFLAIVAMLGLKKLQRASWQRYSEWGRALIVLIIVSVVGFGAYNLNYFDIGRTLDPNMSVTEYYTQELPKIPDSAIFMPIFGWEAFYKYNKDSGKHIYIINQAMLVMPAYRQQLLDDGIKLIVSDNSNLDIADKEMAQSIILLNDNVWTTIITSPSTFGEIVVPANHDISLDPLPDIARINKLSANPPWQWKPWNPYDIMTTSILINDWAYIVVSNHSLFFVLDWGGGFLVVYWLMYSYIERENKKKKAKKDVIT
jgi:hypothetical protein